MNICKRKEIECYYYRQLGDECLRSDNCTHKIPFNPQGTQQGESNHLTAPNTERGKCSTGTTDKPDHEAQ